LSEVTRTWRGVD